MAAIHAHRRTLSATPLTTDVAVAPLSLAENSPFLRLLALPALTVISSTSQGNGGWTRETNPSYDGGVGAYCTANSEGYRFKFFGTSFQLRGLRNANGGTFSVIINGNAAGSGSCNAANLTNGLYYTSPALANGTHEVLVQKTSGAALYLDSVILF